MNFVILTTQRSGSTWMVDVLDKCSQTSVFGELFLPEKMKWHAGSSTFPQYFEVKEGIRPFSTFKYLNQLYREPGNIGFKLMYSNLSRYPEIIPYICARRLPVVHLIRQNVLDIVISSQMARANGQWHIKGDEAVPTVTQIQLDPKALVPRLKHLQNKVNTNRNWLNICRLAHIEISYEALLADPSEFDKVIKFLGLLSSAENLPTSFSKIRSAKYADEISNFDEIREVLAHTEFASLLGTESISF